MKYLQLPDHVFKLNMTTLELKLYCDVWTMTASGKVYWKSNETVASQFGVERRSVIRAIARLESRGLLHRQSSENGRFLSALTPAEGGDPVVRGDRAVTGDSNGQGGDPAVTGGVTEMVQSSDPAVTQIEKKREEEKRREERRGKPRSFDECLRHFAAVGRADLATGFFSYWDARGWKSSRSTRLQNWKSAAQKYIEDDKRFGDIREHNQDQKRKQFGKVDWEDDLGNDIKSAWYKPDS